MLLVCHLLGGTGKNVNQSVWTIDPVGRDWVSLDPPVDFPRIEGGDGLIRAADAAWVAYSSHKVKFKVIIST